MSWVDVNNKLKRTEQYWGRISVCLHGDWCLQCHWLYTEEFNMANDRPHITRAGTKVFIHSDIYLQLFPRALDDETTLISDIAHCTYPQCVNPSHQKRILLRELNPSVSPVSPPVKRKKKYSQMDEKKVREIRKLHKSGKTYREISTRFGTSESNVKQISNYHTWKHVKD